jgi:hypothetical protein
MKTISRVLASLVLVAAASVAGAQTAAAPKFYGEVRYLPLNIKFSDGSKVTPKLARVVVGTEINDNLAAEGSLGLTLSKAEGVSATMAGVFLKPKYAIDKDAEVFARVGVARTSLGGEGSGSMTKAAYGIGAQMAISKDVYGQVDYMHYGKDVAGSTASGFTISVGTRF